ncbi:protein DMP6-like [Coffea eugenioides]|uniref:Protein DMP6 n=1 Tax=Coffea arabica TaxID=13443 RepID=A0A6P6UNQ3_COFAR|nr:protein DMP6-like [Coffea arabica]XP_027149302.1 protein DMP6-like [Coffea eugenioides]
MDVKVETPASPPTSGGDAKTPLLDSQKPDSTTTPQTNQNSSIRQAICSTFKGTAYLASRLPAGTVLAFRLLSPILSNQGDCDVAFKTMTAVLLALCALSCFFLSFTDSFKDGKGNVFFGFATFKGFYPIDRTVTISPEEAAKKKIGPLDFLHGFLSLLVFATIALLDKNIVDCFYPTPSVEIKEIISVLPVANGVVCSILFVAFPTQRHGIGFGADPDGVKSS